MLSRACGYRLGLKLLVLCFLQYAPAVWVESVTADSYDDPVAVEEPAPKRHEAAPVVDRDDDPQFVAALIQAADTAAGDKAVVGLPAPANP